MEKAYDKVVQYVKKEILEGRMKPGDKLPTERELALKLNSSRNSVREGLRVLENIGVLTSQQGSGNYISQNFDETMTEMLSFMYHMKGIQDGQVTEFRLSLEWEAMHLAVERATREQKEEMAEHFKAMENVRTEAARSLHDKAIHRLLVAASQNDFLITNYKALNNLMDLYVPAMRKRIITGMQAQDKLMEAHRLIVEGVTESNLEKGLTGLRDHFGYIEQYR